MRGNIFLIGIGPGNRDYLTGEAKKTLEKVDIIIGYKLYIELIEEFIQDTRLVKGQMTKELERVNLAIDHALEGKDVALISSGDTGVYGMAGPLLAELDKRELKTEKKPAVRVIPGVTALLAAAAKLGAPLMNDFAVISLSDLLVPWEEIEKRIKSIAKTDFVIGVYNPSSKRRKENFARFREILLKERDGITPVGLVWNAGREKERVLKTTLEDLPEEKVDMLTTVIVGNSKSYISDKGDFITPRGYQQ